MKKALVLLAALTLWPIRPAFAWNPLSDFRDNLVWTFGKTAEIGTAIKVAGSGGDLANGDTTTSFLAGICDYRFLSFSYGGTRVNKNNAAVTDTGKIGLRLTSFFDYFKNPPTPEMAFLRNLNIGPSYAIPLLSSPHVGAVFIDINYAFGGHSTAPPAIPAP